MIVDQRQDEIQNKYTCKVVTDLSKYRGEIRVPSYYKENVQAATRKEV